MLIRVFGEGNTDVTVHKGPHEGAIRILLRKLLVEDGLNTGVIEILGARLPRLHSGSGYVRKVKLAISREKDADAIAIVIDRDGARNRDRLSLLQRGRAQAQHDGHRLAWRTAVGVAVEMLEAWLVADTAALAQCGNTPGAQPSPESLSDPKQRFTDFLESNGIATAGGYDQIAEAISLEVLRQRCPAFEAFAADVRGAVGNDQSGRRS